MAVNWQTGEPPCGVALVIEYKFRGWPQAYKRIGMKLPSGNWRLDGHSGEQSDVEISRWSTLDDDRAAMAMGAMEKYIDSHPDDSVDLSKIDGKYVAVLSDSCGYLYADSKREGTSIIEAIEKLTATDQQTKGASDGQA